MGVPTLRYADSRNVSHLVSNQIDPVDVLTSEIGPAFADYRRRWEEARTFQRLPDFPLHVDYEMMFKCNLRCPMCLMSLPIEDRGGYGRVEETLGPEMVVDLIKQGVEAGQASMGFGGLWEPLLAPDLPEIVAQGRALGLVDAMFNTNGLLLTEKTSLALIKAGLTRVMISLDAVSKATYDKMRPGSDLATVTENIVNFMSLKRHLGRTLPLVRLSFCLTSWNEPELPAFVEKWQGEVDFFSIQTFGRYESAGPPGFPQHPIGGPPEGRCAQPHKRLLVRHNGDVLPCCDASGLPLVMGNIGSASLADIWRSQGLADLRADLAYNDFNGSAAPCRACHSKFKGERSF